MRLSDPWSEDDPAVRRMRDALRAAQSGPAEPEPDSQASASIAGHGPPPGPSRRARVSQLIARIRAGDVSAIDALRELVDR